MKLGDAKPQTRGEHSRLEDLVDVVKFKGWVQVRILPTDIISYRQHWINILASKTKREVRIPKICIAHDTTTEELTGECPYCDVESQTSTSYLCNVIVRTLQEDAPAKIKITKAESSSGFKDPDSESWTPVRVLRLTSGLMKKVQELKALNKHKGKTGVKTFDVNHEKYGVDLNIKYDENAKGPEKYQINLAEKSPLSEEELGYLQWELTDDLVGQLGRDTAADAKKELGRMQIVGAEEFADDDDEPKSKKKSAKGKKAAEDDDDDGYDDDEDDDDLPAPKSKKKPAAKKPVAKGKKRPVDDDEDDEEDGGDDAGFDDEDDEEGEPAPRSKKPAAKPAAKGKKKPVDEDDEDEDDLDDDDEEDDEPPARSKKPAAKKPAAKSKKPVAKGKKKPVDDDEDDEEDDEEDDDDEDDDEPF